MLFEVTWILGKNRNQVAFVLYNYYDILSMSISVISFADGRLNGLSGVL